MIAAYPLDEIWPHVMCKIAALRNRFTGHADWTIEDVHRALEERRALMFCSPRGDDPAASFAIVRMVERDGQPVLFVWIGCGMMEHIDALKEIARQAGAVRVEMESPRRGFARRGWQRIGPAQFGMTRYGMEV